MSDTEPNTEPNTEPDLYSTDCPACGAELYYYEDEDGNTEYTDDVYMCSSCHDDVCVECCMTSENFNELEIPPAALEYLRASYSHYHQHDMICSGCITRSLKKYIAEMPLEELPLHINSPWGGEEWELVQKAYKERLATL